MKRSFILLVLFSFSFFPSIATADEPDVIAKEAGALAKASKKLVAKPNRLRAVPRFSSPKKLYDWMKSNLVYEPYEGALRGPQGTLISGGGNSVDLALLAAKELRDRKHEVRFEVVPWNQKSKRDVLKKFVGKASILMKGKPPKSRWNLTQFPQDRIFISVKQRDKWVPFDIVGSPGYGIGPKSKNSMEELPESIVGVYRFKAKLVLEDGQKRTLFEYKVPIHEFAQSGWTLSFLPRIGQPESVVPVFRVAGRSKRADDFPSDAVDTIAVDLVIRQSGLERRETQVLYDKAWGKSLNDIWPVYSLHTFSSWIDFDWSRAQAAAQILASANNLQAWAGERKSGLASKDPKEIGFLLTSRSPLHHAVALDYVGHLDQVTRDLAHTMGVQPMISQPRVVLIASSIPATGVEFRINPALGVFGAAPKQGIPERTTIGFRSMLGSTESVVRHDIERSYGAKSAPWFGTEQNGVVTMDGTGFRKKLKPLTKAQRSFVRRRVGQDGNLMLSASPIQSSPGWWLLAPESGEMNEAIPKAFAPLFSATRSETPASDILKTGQLGLERFKKAKTKNNKNAICQSAKHLRFASQAFCASGKKLELPSLESCIQPSIVASAEFEREGCVSRTKDFRCGAVISNALLTGELTVLYASGETPFEILSPSKKKKKKTKPIGITCK